MYWSVEGVFAHVIGSLELPAPHERKRVVGVIINEASRSKLRAILQNSPRSRPSFAPTSSKASVSSRSFSEGGKATEGSLASIPAATYGVFGEESKFRGDAT